MVLCLYLRVREVVGGRFLFLLLTIVLLSSYTATALSRFPKMKHIGRCSFCDCSVPPTFSNFQVKFTSSFRCRDHFGEDRLGDTIQTLGSVRTSILLLNKSCHNGGNKGLSALFATLDEICAPCKAFTIVKGRSCNCYCSRIIRTVRGGRIQLVRRGDCGLVGSNRCVVIDNMHGPFSLGGGNSSPSRRFLTSSFVVLLARAPSCTRSASMSGTGLILTKRARNKRIDLFGGCSPMGRSVCKGHFLAN